MQPQPARRWLDAERDPARRQQVLIASRQRCDRKGGAGSGLTEQLVPVRAGLQRDERADAEREPLETIRQTLDLNLIAPFRLAQEVFPHMLAAGRGSIVNVSSISGHVGIPGVPQASYAASKLGLSGLTAELAVQWARYGIRVNTVAPGFFRSEITDGMYDDERSLAWL